MKILAINIAFRDELFYKRWRLLAEEFKHSVTLIGPNYYEYNKFGEKIIYKPSTIEETNFCVYHIDMQNKNWLRNDWWSWKYLSILIDKKPDIIYLIGYETKNVVFISIFYKLFFQSKVKLILFTMRGIDMPLKGLEYRLRWNIVKNHFDLVNVHYPHGRELIKKQGGYKGVVNLQTQIGVDKDVFFPSTEYRKNIRKKYKIEEHEFVFGAAIRIEAAKGVFEIIEACENLPMNFKFLLLGGGKDFKTVQTLIKKRKLTNKIILTEKVPYGTPVAMHLNAMDCFVHAPLTTKQWVDTFPLAVIQAMACALPVIGSDSGAVPYQIGYKEMIIPEGNAIELANKMKFIMDHPTHAQNIGKKMLKRVLECFEIRHLNKCLSKTFEVTFAKEKNKMALDQTQMHDL